VSASLIWVEIPRNLVVHLSEQLFLTIPTMTFATVKKVELLDDINYV